jgi:hypothetical protein
VHQSEFLLRRDRASEKKHEEKQGAANSGGLMLAHGLIMILIVLQPPPLAATPVILAALLGACQVAPPPPGPEASLVSGLGYYGRVLAIDGEERTVVVIKDRHPVHGAITRTRGPIRRVQEQNHGAVSFLVAKGFTVLGCEAPLGPLPLEGPARRHRDAIEEASAARDSLDALTVFQPIRYEMEFADALEVLGVEDPELYGADVERLKRILEIRRALARNDVSVAAPEALAANERELRQEIRAGADERGRRAAANLLEAMEEAGSDRGILLLGGAHARGAAEELGKLGVRILVFECAAYRERREPS